MTKRKDYISWDEYFMGIAELSAKRSKDPTTQVGACIVGDNNHILSLGYNGMPLGCNDDDLPWNRNGEFLKTKYPFVCHAELNAILNSGGNDLRSSRIYTTLFPCNECAKAIVQCGIKFVIYKSNKYSTSESVIAAKHIFDLAKIKYQKYIPSNKIISISL